MQDGSEPVVIVKRVSTSVLACELFCSVLARDCGLPCPEPVVILDSLIGSILFGSVYTEHPNLLQAFQVDESLVSAQELNEIAKRLNEWTQLGEVISFDEWIANADRNLQNILWDGFDSFVLIDHGICLGSTPGNGQCENKLLALMTWHFTQTNSAAIERLKNRVINAIANLDPSMTAQAADALAVGPLTNGAELGSQFSTFLSLRYPQLAALLVARFPSAQGELFGRA